MIRRKYRTGSWIATTVVRSCVGSAAVLTGLTAAAAMAQNPLQPYAASLPGIPNMPPSGTINPYNLMPNIYNPQSQPLSPYLNLLSGINPGVNYYYGVRPGTLGMGMGRGGGAPFVAPGGNRPLFFPQLAFAPDPLADRQADPDRVLPPAGHPVFFNNTLGYFPSPLGVTGGNRPALSGFGATRGVGRR